MRVFDEIGPDHRQKATTEIRGPRQYGHDHQRLMRVGGSATPDDPRRDHLRKSSRAQVQLPGGRLLSRGIARPTRCCFIQSGGRSTDLVAADWFARPMIRFRPLRSHADRRAVRGIDDLTGFCSWESSSVKVAGLRRPGVRFDRSIRSPTNRLRWRVLPERSMGVARSSATFQGETCSSWAHAAMNITRRMPSSGSAVCEQVSTYALRLGLAPLREARGVVSELTFDSSTIASSSASRCCLT